MPREIKRVFLGWGARESAPLFAAARALADAFHAGGVVDMSGARIVLTGGRAKRLLLGALVERAEALGSSLLPPSMHTPGEIPTLVLGAGSDGRAPASPVARRLAWMDALRSLPARTLAPLAPVRPADEDARAWGALARMIERASDALAGGRMRFGEAPARGADAIPGFIDADRLLAAGAAQAAYERLLREAGLADDALARIDALREPNPTDTRPITLVGVADLNDAARAALRAHAGTVTAMIVAPDTLADRFDDFGAPLPGAWADADPVLREEQVVFAEGPADQAEAAIGATAGLGGAFAPGDLAVVVADPALLPVLRRRWSRCTEVPLRSATGAPWPASAPARLLARLAEFLERGSFASYAALLRHPDLEAWAIVQTGAPGGVEAWLDELDRAAEERAPDAIGEWLFTSGDDSGARPPAALWRATQTLLAPLLGAHGAPERRPMAAWALPLLEALRTVYEASPGADRGETREALAEACAIVRDGLLSLDAAAARGIPGPPASASEAARFVLDALRHETIPEPAAEDAVEALGWLELPLDPARACVVLGAHEGVVPGPGAADPLLPDSLRKAVGIDHDERRLARDAFHLATLVRTKERLTVVVGRTGAAGEPLRPSRLLFLGDAPIAIRRARRFADPSRDPPPRARAVTTIALGAQDTSTPVLLVAPTPMDAFAVTSFKDFLDSPRLFYLKRALRLKERDDSSHELDPMGFGSLLHEALRGFAESAERDSADEEAIDQSVRAALETLSRERFGPSPGAPVRLQLEFARHRLRAFAAWQAARRRMGWRIHETEWPREGERADSSGSEGEGDGARGTPFDAGAGLTVRLSGRIDRIDRHERDSVFAILDYKTGDKGATPGQTHGGLRSLWKDLQLPLYRHLARPIIGEAAPALGYVLLGKSGATRLALGTNNESQTGKKKNGWDADDLARADDAARAIIHAVRAGEMNDPGRRPPDTGPLAALCGRRALGGAPDDSSENGGASEGEDGENGAGEGE